ncbi:energy-coupling factor transporter transmembrane component T family protein [Bifidobacterium simiarum]|uniref:Cobalt ABC transporter permease n=1 Tax=Bifidobacterium simiarum TaxID=2045441 RepID=A0A2M9HEQ6_9BIFI|nr:energy-coupling factor transporter transmembrane component T [Bifidobacterium simiarum]MBT1165820.1 energy-coupling factor transporter transmembrane protein EcfT [Bifidobacterium simiarum]PJM75279.1 cobalt ABC transporter permease [Bifidobacterium simiarum]
MSEIIVTPPSARHEQAKPPSQSWFIARLNPVSRFICPLIMSLPLFSTLDVVSASTQIILSVVLLWIAGINPLVILRRTWPVWIAAIGSFIPILLYGRTSGEVYFRWAAIVVSEGSFHLAIATFLRVVAIAVPSVIFLLGIDPTDLADGLVQILHLPSKFVYGALAGIRMFTLLQEDWRALGLSRRSRGIGDGNPVSRVLSQAFALLVLSIRRATKLATAMEARGFGASDTRTFARASRLHPIDWVGYAISIVIPAIAVGLAVKTGYWNLPMMSN